MARHSTEKFRDERIHGLVMQEFRPSITDASVLEEAVARTVVLLEATAPLEKINQQTARLDLADAFSSYRDGYEMVES